MNSPRLDVRTLSHSPRNKLAAGLAAITFFFLTATTSSAVVLMLDFGPEAATGANLTNSPYHTASGGSFTDTGWNSSLGVTDVASGLVYSDGAPATGVSFSLGISAAASTTVQPTSTNPSSSSSLGGNSPGVYAGTSVGKDGVFNSTNGTAVGLQVGGLDAGTYEVYVLARNTNRVATDVFTMNAWVGTTGSAGNFDFAAYTQNSVTYGAASPTLTWVEGENYHKFTINLSEGEFLNLAVQEGGASGRGFLNAVQIVAVPETTPAALGGLFFLCILLRRRR